MKKQKERIEKGASDEYVYGNSIKIEDIYLIDDNYFIIIMEELDTSGVEDLYNLVNDIYNDMDLDDDDMKDLGYDDEIIDFINQMYVLRNIYQQSGALAEDINPNNIGRNSYGNFVLLDQRSKTISDENIK